MKVTHISEDMALRTTQALLQTLPMEVRKDRKQLPALVEGWVNTMAEFGYRYREDLGGLVRSV